MSPFSNAIFHRLPQKAALVLSALLTVATATVLTAAPASAACATVTFHNVTYCVATVAQLNAGTYPANTRIALQPVAVLSQSGSKRSLGQVTATVTIQPCPVGQICGDGQVMCTQTWVTTTADFVRLGSKPVRGSAVDVYGKVTASRTAVTPTGFSLVNASYLSSPSFSPCAFL